MEESPTAGGFRPITPGESREIARIWTLNLMRGALNVPAFPG